jgi:hypothetical protein
MSALGRAASIFKTPCLHNTALISDNNSGTELILSGGAVVENLALNRSNRQREEEDEWALSIFSNRILTDRTINRYSHIFYGVG